MLHRKLTVLAAIAGVALSVPALAQNQKPGNAPQPTPTPAPAPAPAKAPIGPATQPQAKPDPSQWKEKTAQLSAEQRELAANLNGNWTTETTVWMDPKQPPMVSKGMAKFEAIMGARFMRETVEGDMPAGKFLGEGLFCFNTVSKEYESSWIDNSATGIMLSSGKKDAKGDLVFSGQYDDSMTGQKMTGKTVMHHEGKDKMTVTMFNIGTGGSESKFLEVVYTRATPGGKAAPKTEEKPKEEPKKSAG
jgi:hypothetical protein